MTAPPTPSRSPLGRPVSASPRPLDARGFTTMSHILVQLSDVGLRPSFAESCGGSADIVWCDDLEELAAQGRAREAVAVVVDLQDREGRSSAAAVASLRAERPKLPIVLWCDRAQAGPVPLEALLRAGVSAVVFRNASDLERRLLGALASPGDLAFQQFTDEALYRRVPLGLQPVFRFLLDQAATQPSLELVARAVGLPPRALTYRLRRAGMPPVSAILTWSRALVAAYRLEHSTEPVGIIARSLGFSAPSGLRALLRRCCHEAPNALREPGGFGWVLRSF